MTDTYTTGKYNGVGIAIETTPGTYKAPTSYIPNTKVSLDPGITDESIDVNIGKATSKFLVARNKAEPSGEIDSPAWPENGLEALLKAMIGDATSAVQGATTAYKHTYTESTSIPSISVTKWNEKQGTVEAMPGCYLNGLEFSYDGPGVVNMVAKFDGMDFDTSQTKPTITLSTAKPFNWGNFKCLIDGTQNSTVTKASISMSRTMNKDYGAHGDGKLAPNILVAGPLGISGSLEFPRGSNAELNNYLDGTSAGAATTIGSTILDRTLALNLTGANIAETYDYDLLFSLPRVNMTKVDPFGDDENTQKYAWAWDALYDTVTSKTLSASSTSKLTAIT